MAAAMCMNTNSLPIALMQSLVITVPTLRMGEDDNKHSADARAISYLFLYSAFAMIVSLQFESTSCS
jgi:auxin efflux carrier family protein